MQILTPAQRKAVFAVYTRRELFDLGDGPVSSDSVPSYTRVRLLTYREFRRSVQPGFDCIMLKWCGMWLGIEADGYTHS